MNVQKEAEKAKDIIDELVSHIEDLNAQTDKDEEISELNEEIEGLKEEIEALNEKIQNLENQVSSMESVEQIASDRESVNNYPIH